MTQNITVQYVRDFFEGSAKEGESRLSVFLDALKASEVEEVRKVCAEVAKTSETLKVRMSEVRQIWGALHHIPNGASIVPGMGYNRASDAARKALAEAQIDWKGNHRLTKAERQEAKAKASVLEQTAEALEAVNFDGSKVAEGLTKVAKAKAEKHIFDAIWAAYAVFGVLPADLAPIVASVTKDAMTAIEKAEAGKIKKAA